MFFSRPIQWYQSHADPIWPDGTFNPCIFLCADDDRKPFFRAMTLNYLLMLDHGLEIIC
jgi:hypothetical protein